VEILCFGHLGLPCGAAAGFVRGGRWFHGKFLSLMDDGRADRSRSDFIVRVGGGSGTVAGLDVIEGKGEKSFDLLGWRLLSCELCKRYSICWK
jgi:hypothetical protein